MSKMKKISVLAVALLVVGIGVWRLTAQQGSNEEQRTKLTKAYNDGNFKVAYDGLRKLALDPKNDPKLELAQAVVGDLEIAVVVRLGELGALFFVGALL